MKLRHLNLIALAGLGLTMLSPAAIAGETTVTGAHGRSAVTQSTHQRTETGLNTQRTTTYPSGKTSSTTGNFTNTGSGNYTGDVTHTNRSGESKTYEVEGQYSRGQGNYQNTGTITGPNGQQTTYNRSGSHAEGQFTRNNTLTYPDGKTRTTEVQGSRTGQGTSSGTVQTTGRNGRTRSGTFQRHR